MKDYVMHETISNHDNAFAYMTVYAIAVQADGSMCSMKYHTGISLFASIEIIRNTALNVLEQKFPTAIRIDIVEQGFYEAFRKEHPELPEKTVENGGYFVTGIDQ